MNWINPLDRVPQVPQDWANHVIYGGVFGTLLSLVVSHVTAFVIVLAVSAAKKAVDYFKEHESVAMCVGKALVSAAWPATFFLVKL